MGAIAFVARRDLQQRAPRVLALVLVVGIAGGLVMTAVAGARRTSSSLERFREAGRSADIELAASPTDEQIDQLADTPGVRAVATLQAFAVIPALAPDFDAGGVPDDAFGTIVDRDRVVAGRRVDPDAADEIMIGEGFARRLHVGIGDIVELESHTPEQTDRILRGEAEIGTPAGPRLQMRVVGIVRRPLDLGEEGASGGLIVMSPGFTRAHDGQVGVFGKYVRIRTDDPRDVPDVLAATRRILGPSVFAARGLALESQGASLAIDVLASALWISAGVAFVAGAIAIAVMLHREVYLVVLEFRTLRDLGCTRRQQISLVGVSTALIAGAGAVVACAVAVLASPLLPVGVARRADPDVGIHADWVVLSLGALVIVAFVVAISAVAAARATPPVRAEDASRRRRATRVSSAVAAFGNRPTMTNGVRMALDPGNGTNALPVRSAFAGVVLGVAGVTATLVFVTSLARLEDTPEHYGVTWDFGALDRTANTPCGGDDYGITGVPSVSSISEVCLQTVDVGGRPVPGMAFTSLRGDAIEPTVTSGRPPRAANEVALGAKTLAQLDKTIGDTVQVHGRDAQRSYLIVGRAVFPTFAKAEPLADGAAFTGAGYAPLFDQNLFNRHFVGRFAPGADRAAAIAEIDAIAELGAPSTPAQPVEIARIEEMHWLPTTIIVVLSALAAIAIMHALVTTVRRRRRELAVLKTLGFVQRQVRTTVAWQAATVTLAGLVVGIPMGILVGDLAWRLVAEGLGIVSPAELRLLLLLAFAALAMVVVQLVAYLPARVAARTRVAAALRTE